MVKLSKLLEETFEDMMKRLKDKYGEVKPEDIEKEEKVNPSIKIIGEGKTGSGQHYIKIFLINEQGKRYIETFYSNPFQVHKFEAKLKNIESFAGQMKAYQDFKKIVDDFESEKLEDVDE